MLGITCDNLKLMKSPNLSPGISKTMHNKAAINRTKKIKLSLLCSLSIHKNNGTPKKIIAVTIINIQDLIARSTSFLSIISSYVSFVLFDCLTGTTFP